MEKHGHILDPEERTRFDEHGQSRPSGGHLMGVVGQAATMLLWVIGFMALVQTMTFK